MSGSAILDAKTPEEGEAKQTAEEYQFEKLRLNQPTCKNCENGGAPFVDHRAGRTVCRQCGLVLESSFLMEASEWRTFAESDRTGPDPNRVGGLTHYLLEDTQDLSTTIDNDGGRLSNLQRTNGDSTKNKLSYAIRKCSQMGELLNLNKDIRNTAAEIYKQLMPIKAFNVGKMDVVIATCLYIAAKASHADRPLKELCSTLDVNRKSVSKCHSNIMRIRAQHNIRIPKREGRGFTKISTAELFGERYMNALDQPAGHVSVAKKIIRNINKLSLMSGQQPATIASTGCYLACQLHENEDMKRTYMEISGEARISASTIMTSYRKKVWPNRMDLVPKDFEKYNMLSSLSNR